MTSVYYALKDATSERLLSVAARVRYPGDEQIIDAAGHGFLWVGDDPGRYGPCEDTVSGVRVITSGRLAWPAQTWSLAETLPFTGGLAGRPLLARYLEGGPEAVAPYNGATVVVISDPRDGTVHLWTDQFGYHPCFLHRDGVITTFPDAVLADPHVPATWDQVSMAEFMRAWRVTPPHTYYQEVKHAGAAAYHRWTLATGEHVRRDYWSPLDKPFYGSLEEGAEALAQAITQSVTERTAVSERPVFFLSGGADSRVLLYGGGDAGKIVGLNLFERQGLNEATVARLLCERAGARYVGYQRDKDFYPRMLQENVRWSGAMWSTEDSHYLGVRDAVDSENADLVMTACTTDWLFKGYGLEKRYRQLFGRNLPIFRYADWRVDGFLPNVPSDAPEPYAEAIKARMDEWFAGCPRELKTERDRMMVEDRRVRPTCYTVSVSGQMMYRVFPFDTLLADSRMAECYARTPPKWKLNGDIWGRAARQVCAKGGPIVDANFGWPVGAGQAEKLFYFAKGWLGRRLPRGDQAANQDDDRPQSNGSWPDLGWYARHSETLRKFWESAPEEHRVLLRAVVGFDPWAEPLADLSRDPAQLFRMMTLLAHWRVAGLDAATLGPTPPAKAAR